MCASRTFLFILLVSRLEGGPDGRNSSLGDAKDWSLWIKEPGNNNFYVVFFTIKDDDDDDYDHDIMMMIMIMIMVIMMMISDDDDI